jgi:ribosomal protein S6--L-glutamate ligase
MRIIALSEKPGWHVDDLRRAAMAHGQALTSCSWLAMVGRVGIGTGATVRAGNTQLDSADAVIVRTMPPGTLEQVVFRMDLLHRLESRGVLVINNPRAIETAVDKYLALARMEAAGLTVPATIVCQRLVDAMAAFDELGGDVVVKPIFGSEGWGMTRITDGDLAARAFAQLERQGAAIYIQRFIAHGGSDLRLFVINGQVVASMRRIADDWRTNVARGATTEPIVADVLLQYQALRAAQACGAAIAGVDILLDGDGKPHVIEVNAAPGWKALSATTGIDIAGLIIEHITAVRAAAEAHHAGS